MCAMAEDTQVHAYFFLSPFPRSLLTVPTAIQRSCNPYAAMQVTGLACGTENKHLRIRFDRGGHPGCHTNTTSTRSSRYLRKLWYESNKFGFDIHDCDATLVLAFCKIGAVRTIQSRCVITFRGRQHWENLVQWCKVVWQGDTQTLSVLRKDGLSKYLAVVAAAHDIAWTHRDSEWAKCKYALETLRYAVGAFEPKWLEGKEA